jgi:hypothetical protein
MCAVREEPSPAAAHPLIRPSGTFSPLTRGEGLSPNFFRVPLAPHERVVVRFRHRGIVAQPAAIGAHRDACLKRWLCHALLKIAG